MNKSFALLLLLSACDPGGYDESPETQREACEIIAQVTCDVAVDCSTNDNLSDVPACVDHATEHCLLHHEVAEDDPPVNWEPCAEILDTFSCDTRDYYKPCFYPDFNP